MTEVVELNPEALPKGVSEEETRELLKVSTVLFEQRFDQELNKAKQKFEEIEKNFAGLRAAFRDVVKDSPAFEEMQAELVGITKAQAENEAFAFDQVKALFDARRPMLEQAYRLAGINDQIYASLVPHIGEGRVALGDFGTFREQVPLEGETPPPPPAQTPTFSPHRVEVN